jgi:phosphate/sulfate permease
MREIGPIGTATRILGGVIAIALPVALDGIGWWDIGVALIALPLVALAAGDAVTWVYERLAPEALARREAIEPASAEQTICAFRVCTLGARGPIGGGGCRSAKSH